MTIPPEEIEVKCPECSRKYRAWCRPSINLGLDDFDQEYIREASSATCPHCGYKVDLSVPIVDLC